MSETECKHEKVNGIKNVYLRIGTTKTYVNTGICDQCKKLVVALHGIHRGWELVPEEKKK